MSLIGEVSGVGLAELLQVAALAGGHSVLEVRGTDSTAWFGFEAGALIRFARSDISFPEPSGAGEVSEEGDDPRLKEAEEALLEVFRWADGVFVLHCDERAKVWTGPDGIRFPVAVRPESLALSAARRLDEERRASPGSGGEPQAEATAAPAPSSAPPVVLVDPDFRLLQAVKQGLGSLGNRVHIFTHSEQAWFRIQQYLLRGQVPVLVLGESVKDPVEPGCRPGWRRFTSRIHGVAPTARVILLSSEGSAASPSLQAVLPRPEDPTAIPQAVEALTASLARVLSGGA